METAAMVSNSNGNSIENRKVDENELLERKWLGRRKLSCLIPPMADPPTPHQIMPCCGAVRSAGDSGGACKSPLANGVRGGGVGRPLEPNLARDRLFFAVPGENMANEEKPHDNSFVLCGLLELPPHGGGVGKVDFPPHFSDSAAGCATAIETTKVQSYILLVVMVSKANPNKF